SDVPRTPVIQTNSGPVQGVILTTVWESQEYSAFKGIPYATPPIGNLRFRPPVPPESWNQTRDVINDTNSCPQEGHGVYSGNEDCLYLNVYTPETTFKNITLKPVMVWIYGGSFLRGNASSSVYGPDFFMEQDVVIVTFNYRLGPLGFLYLNHTLAPGNAAMYDQVMVLEWVRDNIVAFGGDPNQVTLFGQSAGSASVTYHVLSERSSGLFHQAICQSGTLTPYFYRTHEEAFNNAKKLAAALDFHSDSPKELLEFYRQADPKDLMTKTNKIFSIFTDLSLPFTPVKDNPNLIDSNHKFLPECPINIMTTQKFNKMPMIVGFTHDEMLDFTEGVYHTLNITIDLWERIFPILPIEILKLYDLVKTVSVDASDYIMKGPIDFTQRLYSQGDDGNPIYYYQLSYVSNYSMHKLDGIPVDGIAHYDDVGLLFNVQRLDAPTDPEYPFNQMRQKIVTLWANFAKYQNPTPDDANPLDVIWQPSNNSGRLLNITDNSQMINRKQAISSGALDTEKFLYLTMPITNDCKTVIYPNFFSIF
ncbi:Acetylcholinesterase, partial [Eufriesea mexicana]